MGVAPKNIGIVHFIGIGGIGMSGIAEIMHSLGYSVQGSDISHNANVSRLLDLGIKVFTGQSPDNIKSAGTVVVSTAIKGENPELKAARAAGIPVLHRAEMLAELMRLRPSIAIAGSHGKTTITSLLAHVLASAGEDPTVISGGVINTLGTNAKLGQGKWMVVEADESDGSFVKLPAQHVVVTNIDPEHMDHYPSFDDVLSSFARFVHNIPFDGTAVMCVDHPQVAKLMDWITDRRFMTYGFSECASVRGTDVKTVAGKTQFTVHDSSSGLQFQLSIPMLGTHNVQNALAVVAMCLVLGVDELSIVRGMASFEGVQRRFTLRGEVDGMKIIDDYAHHPVEIEKTIEAAKLVCQSRVIAVLQPHRYTRLRDLFSEFSKSCLQADEVVVLPIYSAGEAAIEGVDAVCLAAKMQESGQRSVIVLDDVDALAEYIAKAGLPGDYVVCMGAGSITQYAAALPEKVNARRLELAVNVKVV